MLQQDDFFKRNHSGELVKVLVDGISGATTFADRLQSEYTHGVLFSVSYTDCEFGGARPQPREIKAHNGHFGKEINQFRSSKSRRRFRSSLGAVGGFATVAAGFGAFSKRRILS